MAKKKTETINNIDSVLANLLEQFGEDTIVNANSIIDNPKQVISVSPRLDLILGGGIPEGSWVTLTGHPKTGKTSLALHIAKQAQLPEFGNRHVYYLNIEGRLKPMNLAGLNIDSNRFHVIQSTNERLLSAQDFLTIGLQILKVHTGCVMIVDSISSLVHEKELLEGIGTSTRGGTAMLTSQFCTQAGLILPTKKNIVVAITHKMANTSGYGASIVEKGGFGIAYQVDVKMEAKTKEFWVSKDKNIGIITKWSCHCNAMGVAPSEIESYLRFNHGIDELYELITLGQDFGIVSGTTWLDFDGQKFQGKENFRDALVNDKELENKLKEKVKEIVN